MRRTLITASLIWLSLAATAQVRFGYFSFSHALSQMPQSIEADRQIDTLRQAYQREARHNEEEFQRKFTDFLEGQKDFPTNILQKRQLELQDLMDKSIRFRQECEDLLRRAADSLHEAVADTLTQVVRQVAIDGGYAYILNTDQHALPYVNALIGDDVTELILRRLGLLRDPEPQPEPQP